MKKLLFILIAIILIGCKSFTPLYKSGNTNNIQFVVDSISKADSLQIPPIAYWIKTDYITADSIIYRLSSFYKFTNSKTYILTVYKDSIYHWTYRIE